MSRTFLIIQSSPPHHQAQVQVFNTGKRCASSLSFSSRYKQFAPGANMQQHTSNAHTSTLVLAAVQDMPSKSSTTSKAASSGDSQPLYSSSYPIFSHGIIPGPVRISGSKSFPNTSGTSSTTKVTASLPPTCPLPRYSTYPRPSPPGFVSYPRPIVPWSESTCVAATRAAPSLSRRSTYPRPSPPGFFYPEPIVPRSMYEGEAGMRYMDVGRSGGGNMLGYRSFGFEGVVFTILLLGFAWAAFMTVLKFPPHTWRFFACCEATAEERQKQDRRPIDKPSKYAPPESLSTTSSSTYLPRTAHLNNTYPSNRHGTSSSGTIRFNLSPSPSPTPSLSSTPSSPIIPSPPNPFLTPPPPYTAPTLHHRTSTEWRAQRTVFFSPSSTPPPSRSPSPKPTSTHSPTSSITSREDYAAMNEADIMALEEGSTPTLRRKVDKGSWVDLKKVEDAVNGLMGRVARWTDDVGGGEGSVLPVSNGGRESVKVE